MKIVNRITKKVISRNAKYVNNLMKKFIDLFVKEEIEHDDAVIVAPCKNINTYFAKSSVDVLFVDENYNICYMQENLEPWKKSEYVRKAKFAIQLRAGKIREKRIMLNSNIQILAE